MPKIKKLTQHKERSSTATKQVIKYAYKKYSDIPAYMSDYIRGAAGKHTLKDIPLKDINNFLNGLEDWFDDLPEHNYRRGLRPNPNRIN